MGDLNRMCMIGVGGMARHHIRNILKMQDSTRVEVVCEPSAKMYDLTAELFRGAGLTPPPNEPNLDILLKKYKLDSAFIITPHVYHFEQTRMCLEAGLDVLLEKPMVMNADEALRLINIRDQSGKLLVVAFPGSLSPNLRTAVKMLRAGEFGKLLTISATVWQGWGPGTANTWRQAPELSGGGFLFDTGAHMLNTVVDLAGEEFSEVTSILDFYGRPVEILGVVIGKLKSGGLVTLHACGETIPSCASEVMVFCEKAIIRTGIWGERFLVQRHGQKEFEIVETPPSLGVWEQFLKVKSGEVPNPCPPEVGLRMAKLYDAIKASAALGGQPVKS